MSQTNSKTEILYPSPSSLALCFVSLLLVILIVVLPRLGGDSLLQLFLGDEAGLDLIRASKNDLGSKFDLIFSSDLLGRAVTFGVWMFVGLTIYIICSGFYNVVGELEEEASELEYVHQNKRLRLKSDFATLSLRLAVAAGWTIFTILCIRFVLSFLAFAGYLALIEGSTSDWLNFLAGCVIFLVALHLHVVFARLVVGRTRIWQPAP